MIYGKYNAINYNKQKIIKLHQGISPIYNNYISNASKNNNNNSNNINTYAYQKENKIKKNQYLTPNSVSKTTKNSPRNIFNQYNHFSNKYKNNSNINQHTKYETNINSPRKTFLKQVNFKSKKLNLKVFSDNEDFNTNNLYNRNLSVINTIKHNNDDNSFIFLDNKSKNEITKIQVNNLRNQLDKILSSKNMSKSNVKANIHNNNNYMEKNKVEDTSIFTNENSFIYDSNTLTGNRKNNKTSSRNISYI